MREERGSKEQGSTRADSLWPRPAPWPFTVKLWLGLQQTQAFHKHQSLNKQRVLLSSPLEIVLPEPLPLLASSTCFVPLLSILSEQLLCQFFSILVSTSKSQGQRSAEEAWENELCEIGSLRDVNFHCRTGRVRSCGGQNG